MISPRLLRARRSVTMRWARRAAILSAIAGLVVLVGAASALAAGPVVNVGTPLQSGSPSVAVQSNGSAVIAWADTEELAGANDFVQYCVLPAGATSCQYSGNLATEADASKVDDVSVVVDGSTISIIADVYGASSQDYVPDQEWQSTDGGATWAVVNDGKSVSVGYASADTEPQGAVVVPGGNELGYGYETADGPPTFHAFQESPGVECSAHSCAAPKFATLEPTTNPDVVGNGGASFAAQSGPNAGVIGIFFTDSNPGPLECSDTGTTADFGFAFAYGSGNQSATNSYDISPGNANSAWKRAVTLGDCDVEYQAVDGGPSGFGVLEDNLATNQTIYHRFDQTNEDFDTPETRVSSSFEEQPAVSQDGAGGVYATYLNGGFGGAVALSYSYDGGNTWSGPNILNANSDGGVSGLTNSVNSNGQGFLAWTDTANGSVYAESFTASDSVPAPLADSISSTQTSGSTTGPSLTIDAGTIGETDTATVSGPGAAHATGTMRYALYSNSSCTNQVFNGGSAVVNGGTASASAPVTTALADGKYYWRAFYSGNSGNIFGAVGNEANSTACGSEILTVAPAATVGAGGTTNGKTLTISISCGKTPCSGHVSVTTAAKAGKANLARVTEKKKKKGKTKTITLASGKFKLTKAGSHKVKLGVSRAGKKYLRGRHGRLKVTIVVSASGSKVTRTITITIVKPHKKTKHQ